MSLLLSIIVPVYNVEKYLVRCIDSLLNQDISQTEYEVLLIDDGSTDNCGKVCDTYASRYSNIRVLHQVNSGLGASRNKGVSVAEGKYIQFVDSDDYLCPNVLGTLLRQIHKDSLDVLRFNYENVNEEDELIYPNKNPKLFSDYSDSPTTGQDFLLNRLGFACYACQFIIKKELASQVSFMVDIHYEDTEWITRFLPIVTRISSTNLFAYNYRVRKGSITKSKDILSVKKNLKDQLYLISILKDRGKGLIKPSWYEAMISITVISILQIIAKSLYPSRGTLIQKLRQIGVFPLSTFRQNRQSKYKINLINLSPRLFCFIYHFIS